MEAPQPSRKVGLLCIWHTGRMTTPVQRGKQSKPSARPGSSNQGTIHAIVHVTLDGSASQVDADYAAIVAASYTAGSVTITMD